MSKDSFDHWSHRRASNANTAEQEDNGVEWKRLIAGAENLDFCRKKLVASTLWSDRVGHEPSTAVRAGHGIGSGRFSGDPDPFRTFKSKIAKSSEGCGLQTFGEDSGR